MSKNSRFKPGQSGNPETQFRPGNRHRFQAGQSGNPSGKPKSRQHFEEAFTRALLEQGSPEEAAALLWGPARKGEPWAVQAVLQRLAPSTPQNQLTKENNDETPLDLNRLSDEQLDQWVALCQLAAIPTTAEGGESRT